MHPESDPLQRLFHLAKQAPPASALSSDRSAEGPPFGFTTRVLANCPPLSREKSPWEHLALSALPVAAAVTLLCVLASALGLPRAPMSEEDQVAQAFLQTALHP